MPVVNFLTSAASFLYAVSSMLTGAQNNAAVQQSFVSNFQSSPTHFLPVGQRTPKSQTNNDSPHLRDVPNFLNNNNGSYYEYHQDVNNQGGKDSSVSSTIFFPAKVGGGYGQSPPNDESSNVHGPIEISYHDGETIATLFTDEYGNVTRCEMLEVNKPSEQKEALANLAAQNKLIEKTNFNTMLNIIRACQALDRYSGRGDPVSPVEAIVQTKVNMWTIVNGILPGTKWCGVKDIAEGWNDLGPEKELDKCCRSHDLCPRKVLAFRAAYGLVNWSFYTKSHCECDAAFYDCLKEASKSNPTAELMGGFYFNVLKMQCIDEENPPACVNRTNESSQSCLRWENDYSRNNQRYVFREYRQAFR